MRARQRDRDIRKPRKLDRANFGPPPGCKPSPHGHLTQHAPAAQWCSRAIAGCGWRVAAGVLIGWHRVIDWWRLRSRRFAKLLAGEGIMLIHGGNVLEAHCRRGGINRDELLQALREHGVADIGDVLLAVLEPDGAISVIRNDEVMPGTRPHHRIKARRATAPPPC